MNTERRESAGGRQASPSPACDFCGLPLAGRTADIPERRYCCHGCRFAASIAAADGDEGQARWAMTRLGLAVFFSMNVMVFTMLLWSQPLESSSFASAWYDAARYACLLFTLPVILLLGGPLVEDAWSELRRGRPSLSLLLVVGVAAALAYSLRSLVEDNGHVFFEVACTILVATTLGRWLEATGKLKTTEALRGLARLLPEQVRIIRGDREQMIPAGAIAAGDVLRILPGERIAADGVVTRHVAAVDDQAITGESLPIVKEPGDRILSGTLVLDGPLEVEATAAAGEGTLAWMIAAVRQATAARTHYGRLVERISRWFLPAIASVALATFLAHARASDPAGGLLAALAVLVIACPCALGLATPMAIWAAVGRGAQAGVLVRDGDSLALLARAKTVCFDKTGTLTTGTAKVAELVTDDPADRPTILRVARALAGCSTHPLAVAVANFTAQAASNEPPLSPTSLRSIPGRGLCGILAGIRGPIHLGSRDWLIEAGQAWPPSLVSGPPDCAETCVAWGGRIRGIFFIHEELRPEAEATVRLISKLGLSAVMLTGDRRPRAAAIAEQLGLDFHGELLPDGKLAAISELKSAGPVVMVGDGINDAPALAAADVGIALGSGTDIARNSAGVCLLGNDLSRLPWLVGLARTTVQAVRWNLFWAFAYNVVGVGLAAAGWMHPVVAAIAMGASSLLVVTNSLTLTRYSLDQTFGTQAPPSSDRSLFFPAASVSPPSLAPGASP